MTKAPPTTPRKILARSLQWSRTPPCRGFAAASGDPWTDTAGLAAALWTDPKQLAADPAGDPPTQTAGDPPAGDPPAGDPPAPPPRVDPTGGRFGAGIIRGFAVATRGEALGHGYWLDSQFIADTAAAINAAGEDGLKSRFTHPSLSADGLGTFLGRAMNAQTINNGDQVVADLHIDPAAHTSPKGNLAEYAMKLAQTDPAAFGASIVFKPDEEAAANFQKANSREAFDDKGRPVRVFFSPDAQNTANLPHVRLAELRAVDIVDSPAANPGGMFAADPLLDNLDALAAYAVGLTDQPPAENALDADPDRLREYLGRFLEARGLAIGPTSAKPTHENLAELLDRYRTRFGNVLAAEYLIGQQLTWPEALDAYAASLEQQLAAAQQNQAAAVAAALEAKTTDHAAALAAAEKRAADLAAELDKANRRLAAVPTGLATPISQADPAADPPAPKTDRLGSLTPAAARYALALTIPTAKPAK